MKRIVGGALATVVAFSGCAGSNRTERAEPERRVASSSPSAQLCNIESLGPLDLFGDGSEVTAVTATHINERGRCPQRIKNSYFVGLDLDGDSLPETTSEPMTWCVFCRPVGATDLDADGDLELVVLEQGGSVSSYGIYSAEADEVTAMTVAPPGHRKGGHRPGHPLIFWVGGDEGFAGSATCRNYPSDPVLVLKWSDRPVEGPGSDTTQVHVTALRASGRTTLEVIRAHDDETPTRDPAAGGAQKSRDVCGLDLSSPVSAP